MHPASVVRSQTLRRLCSFFILFSLFLLSLFLIAFSLSFWVFAEGDCATRNFATAARPGTPERGEDDEEELA